jgi:coproporphyrinogen III oxidase
MSSFSETRNKHKRKVDSNTFSNCRIAICAALEEVDGKAKFIEDKWDRKEGVGRKNKDINTMEDIIVNAV